MSTYEFETSGVDRLVGTIKAIGGATNDVPTQQASGLLQQEPGGGGSSPVQAIYTGTNVSILNGAAANLTWDTLFSGTELLDRTDPANPTFLAAGTYAATVTVLGDALTASGYALVQVTVVYVLGSQTSEHPELTVGESVTSIVDAGAALAASVDNQDGVAARNFNIALAAVVKIA